MRTIRKLVIHCDGSDDPKQDSIKAVKHLHTAPTNTIVFWGEYKTRGKGWNDVGYQFYIPKKGEIEIGRPINIPGAHCYGHNFDSIGICLSGSRFFTLEQRLTVFDLILELCEQFGLDPNEDVYPHNHFNKFKTCPNVDWFDRKKEETWSKNDPLDGDIEE